MISKDEDDKLVRIYCFICDKFEELEVFCERLSNNNKPEFTDQEIMTIYIFAMHHEGLIRVKQIHRFASKYLRSWFPILGQCYSILGDVFDENSYSLCSNFANGSI